MTRDDDGKNDDDADLLGRAQGGDALAFEAIVRRHFDAIHAYARRALGGDDRAQETTQETFVRAYRYRASYDPAAGSVRAWLVGIAANRIRDARRAQRKGPAGLSPERARELADSTEAAFEALAREDVRGEVRAALAALDDEERTILELRYMGELSYEDVASALGISVGAARLRAFRARDVLARKLARLVGEEGRS